MYQRPNYELGNLATHPAIKIFEAPLMQISASYIRKCIREGHSIQYIVTQPVFEYINSSSMYK